MIDNLKLQLNNHQFSASFENGVCSSTLSDDDHFTEISVFNEPRHNETIEGLKELPNQSWRTKERMKTMSVAIVLCLNVGVDPPDVVKPNPSAVLQCWTDPFSTQPTKAAETIAAKLVKQYERWQPRARYKHCIDPTVEDIKKLCTTLRRTSKEERVLFHYNGHGVPKPTVNGEIWVFNRSFTQYIPLSLFDLQQWMGSPSIYVFDCSNAGIIVQLFNTFAIQHQKEYEMNVNSSSYMKDDLLNSAKISPPPNYQNCILLAACDKGETLPLHPDLPADLFTSCLTTPIKTFLVWFIKRNSRKLAPNIDIEMIDKIPGSLTDRKSILGELNWIFTAITDTIAWNTLPRDLFQRLFRQDLLVASLFRNFLLAQRIMRSYDCTPVSNPPIKSVHQHHMWKAWDLAVDNTLTQLSQMDLNNKNFTPPPYIPSQFFTEQLTAFQVWLKLSSFPPKTPEQLPIVLQVLLSQVHRSRALDLLGSFLSLGPWAVNLALSVGIFPYVLKLLQASAKELRPFLVFIWAKILAIDESYQSELVRENAHVYFMKILADSYISTNHQIMSAFVLSVIVRHNPVGQNTVVQGGSSQHGSIIDIALSLLLDNQEDHSNLRKWLLICLGNVWENNAQVKGLATRNAVCEKLYVFLEDPVPEVRAAAVYALGTFINSITARNEHVNEVDCNVASTLVQKLFYDSSPLVRKEILVTMHWFIIIFENIFIVNVRKNYEENVKLQQLYIQQTFGRGGPPGTREHSPQNSFTGSAPQGTANHMNAQLNVSQQLTPPNSMKRVNSANSLLNLAIGSSTSSKTLCTVYNKVWQMIELYQLDPAPDVAKMANLLIVDIVNKANLNRETSSLSCNSEPDSPSNSQQHSYVSNDSPIANTSAAEASTSFAKPSSRSSTPVREAIKHPSGRVSVASTTSPYIPSSSSYNSITNHGLKRTVFGRDPMPSERVEVKDRNGTTATANEPSAAGSSRADHRRDNYQLYNSEVQERARQAQVMGAASSSISATSNGDLQACRKPLVSTGFIDWCTKHFCQPCTHLGICGCVSSVDMSAQGDMVAEWRSKMLCDYYHKTKANLELHRPNDTTEVIVQRKNVDASLLALHPFEKCLLYANGSNYSVWNYSGQKALNGQQSSSLDSSVNTFSNETNTYVSNGHIARITDLKLINTHDRALVMLASDDCSVKIWADLLPRTFSNLCPDEKRVESRSLTPRLATAFFMFEETAMVQSTTFYRSGGNRLLLWWEQSQQRLVAGGEYRLVRLWDANKEMKIKDIITGADHLVTSISSDYHHLICVGGEDGSVRIFDDRQKSNACQNYYSDRNGPIVNAKIWPDSYANTINLVSGNRSGDICWYDRRSPKAVKIESNAAPMTAMDFHENTNVFACSFGTDSSETQIFTLDTIRGPVLKNKYCSVKSLSFHSLKNKFALATSDGTLSLYKSALH